ncbi:hypothetical protein RR46_02387 [Papilio xuthus]|uniref:Uncharacterized protein n=1 Tax=Papilio xuthus TaxID=66420 RepID=A0A194Q701_PAPXU|nr:hypothetical protein RR46_02387 [Papilio xuthus]
MAIIVSTVPACRRAAVPATHARSALTRNLLFTDDLFKQKNPYLNNNKDAKTTTDLRRDSAQSHLGAQRFKVQELRVLRRARGYARREGRATRGQRGRSLSHLRPPPAARRPPAPPQQQLDRPLDEQRSTANTPRSNHHEMTSPFHDDSICWSLR